MDWNKIATISNLDSDKQFSSSETLISNVYSNTNDLVIDDNDISLTGIKASTSTSLMIESLVHLLCVLLQEGTEQAEISYQKICAQLCTMGLIDNSYSLNEFAEMRSQYQMEIYKIICAAHDEDIPVSLPATCKKYNSVEMCWSRYKREFDETAFIAGGGFGKVFRARHKLDCIEYAIKQIRINSTSIQLCHLAEVKTIASLNHPNIVQYKAAWLEPFLQRNCSPIKVEQNESSIKNEKISDQFETSDAIEIVFESSEHTDADTEEKTYSSISTNDNQLVKYNANNRSMKSAILYIQMSLCQLTLQKWLSERNSMETFESYYSHFFKNPNPPSHVKVVYDIFHQILTGLEYIHSKNIIHHDIKPSNIFLICDHQDKLTVQLGDFGLSCPLQDDHSGVALGTKLYAAPEQLRGECNPKSDVYSLGIVLLELLVKFSTDMERVKTIENARKGIFPTELNKQSVQLLTSLLKKKKERPTTKEVLEIVRNFNIEYNIRSQLALELGKDRHIKQLKNTIQTLKDENDATNCIVCELKKKIICLENVLELRNQEISELKKRLIKYE